MTARTDGVRASVTHPDGRSEVVELPTSSIPPTWGVLDIEASGVCGTDVQLAARGLDAPTILGHHPVGTIARVAGEADAGAPRVGDRVVVEEYLPCGACEACRGDGTYRFCPGTDIFTGGRRVGLTPVDVSPGLWGGNAEQLVLPPNAVLHPVPITLSAEAAVWALPLANALDWVAGSRTISSADAVVVVGPGQHGLAAVAAAHAEGAGRIVAVGVAGDEGRLELARLLGATDTVVRHRDEAALREHVEGWGAQLVVHTAGPDLETSLACVAPRGTVVLAGIGGVPAVDPSVLVRGAATIRGVRGRDPRWVGRAIAALADGSAGLGQVPTLEVPLEAVGTTLRDLADGALPDAPHVVVRPRDHRPQENA